ncbi:Enteropeptidase [Dissostichus eleginoides]|uniref:Enteropeptidase n=1 Tax=Dissostichus eleginoides TaxID=100907 RepID=A0AAD9B1F7_DISEL|nr:Enteropeptidase [Dissostichus eleginoides]
MKRFSFLEVLLSVLCSLLLLCCLALIVLSWIRLEPSGAVEPTELSGRMLITEGAFYSEELKNSSSLRFKSLAYDVQHLVSEAFGHSDLKQHFLSCQVNSFSQGSVAVTFDLWFNQLVDLKEAEQWLGRGFRRRRHGIGHRTKQHPDHRETGSNNGCSDRCLTYSRGVSSSADVLC